MAGPCAGCSGVPAALWPQSSAGKAALEGLGSASPPPASASEEAAEGAPREDRDPRHRGAPFRTGLIERRESGLRFPGCWEESSQGFPGCQERGPGIPGRRGVRARTCRSEGWATRGVGQQLGSYSPISCGPGVVER